VSEEARLAHQRAPSDGGGKKKKAENIFTSWENVGGEKGGIVTGVFIWTWEFARREKA